MPNGPAYRTVIVALAAGLYAAVTSIAILRGWPHFEYIGIGLQLFFLLPALVLYGSANGAAAAWNVLARCCLLLFPLLAAVVSWRTSGGVMISDESSYRHQARIFAAGKLFAPPPPGASDRPADAPKPIFFTHEIVWRKGWYSKYPVGWPLMLALPEAIGLGWLVTPLLGTVLLLITRRIARLIAGPVESGVAVVLMALSPYVLANSVGRMSHALAAVLVAATALACLEGIRTQRLSRFAWMFGLLVCGFHVRPFTMMVAAVVLGIAALWGVRNDRAMLVRAAVFGMVAAIASAASVLVYNWIFTGEPLLSPYALQRGTALPPEVGASFGTIASNLISTWRFAAQSTWLSAFPLMFLLAGYGFWIARRQKPEVWIPAALFCCMVMAHFAQFESSSSVVGERYWFEAYFCVVVLAAIGIVARRPAAHTVAIMAAVQVIMLVIAAVELDRASSPRRKVRTLAETYAHCHCVVFLRDSPPFYGEHLNLNSPNWKQEDVFYAVDPGFAQRAEWAARLGRTGWVVIDYDANRKDAEVNAYCCSLSFGERLKTRSH